MPRPKGLGTDSCAELLYFWAIVAVLAAIALVTLSQPAKAVNAGCTTVDLLELDVKRKFPGQPLKRLEGAEAAGFMAAYNRIPPISNLVATELLILFHERSNATRIAFFREGCAVATATVPLLFVRSLLRKIQGASI